MALIPLERLGAPSQKTSLLGGFAQILINPRPSPRLANVGLFVQPKSQQVYSLWIHKIHIRQKWRLNMTVFKIQSQEHGCMCILENIHIHARMCSCTLEQRLDNLCVYAWAHACMFRWECPRAWMEVHVCAFFQYKCVKDLKQWNNEWEIKIW